MISQVIGDKIAHFVGVEGCPAGTLKLAFEKSHLVDDLAQMGQIFGRDIGARGLADFVNFEGLAKLVKLDDVAASELDNDSPPGSASASAILRRQVGRLLRG